ncbi:MAG: DUF1294 domain-containing protein [Anaerolineae bacterium]|nr:DUF1294 domain-containing protein [Anaerolineae bacterium]
MSQHYICIDCGRGFTLSYEEQRWYQEKGWPLPKRCEDCRSQRRHERDPGNMGFSGPPSQPKTGSRRCPADFSEQAPAQKSGQQPPGSRHSLNWWANPYARFGLISLVAVLLAAAAALLTGLPWWLVLIVVVVAVNGITLALYRYDKAIAGGEFTRVPEKILLALAFFGGSPAAYVALYRFRQRHKVQKLSFILPFWLIVTGQILALCSLLTWLGWA